MTDYSRSTMSFTDILLEAVLDYSLCSVGGLILRFASEVL